MGKALASWRLTGNNTLEEPPFLYPPEIDLYRGSMTRLLQDINHNLDPAHKMAVKAGSGSPGQLQWLDSGARKRFVFMLRACDTFQPKLCQHIHAVKAILPRALM